MSNIGRIDDGGPCEKCGNKPTIEGHDACIGTLPNIMNACCGHGGRNEPYVQFYSFEDAMQVYYVNEDDIGEVNCIRGEKAKKYILDNTKPSLIMPDLLTKSSAIISECGLYRYQLTRTWGIGKPAVFVMLNPSTADANEDDATIRRCISFAKKWNCGGIIVVNLFAYRATDPKELHAVADPQGPGNLTHVFNAARCSQLIVCAWGAYNKLNGQDKKIIDCIKRATNMVDIVCLGTTKAGHPKHPLYLPKDAPMQIFSLGNGEAKPSVNGSAKNG